MQADLLTGLCDLSGHFIQLSPRFITCEYLPCRYMGLQAAFILMADGTHTSHMLEGKKPHLVPLPPAPHFLPQPGCAATLVSLIPAVDLPGVMENR